MNGWIALYRKLLTWQWHDEPKMVALWVHILLRACHETVKYRGITTKRGQLATTVMALAAETGLSRKEVRICLKRLVEDKNITTDSIRGFITIISVVNYDQYQTDYVMNIEKANFSQCASDDCEQNTGMKGQSEGNERANFETTFNPCVPDGCGRNTKMKGQYEGNERALEQCDGNEEKNERANFNQCVSDGYKQYTEIKGQNEGNKRANFRAMKGQCKGNERANFEVKFSNCVLDSYNQNVKGLGQCEGNVGDIERANFGAMKGTRINNNNIYPPPPPSHADAYAREAGCGTPPTGSGDGEADVGKQLQELLCDPAYSPIILMRSKMTVEEAFVHIPEFVAQCRLRGKTWKNIRELTEHFANWLQRKQTYLNEQKPNNNGTPPRGGDADERERHNAVVQTALGLMAGSTRDD